MRRLTFRLIVTLLTFIIGVTSAALWFFTHQSLSNKNKVVESSSAPIPAKRERTIVSGMAGEGISKDGYPTSFAHHKYSDGTSIHQLSVFYKSPKRANAELQKRLKEAVEIIRREPALDEKGHQIGGRVVATFAPYKGSSAVWAELLWTEGSRFVSQRRSSLESILEDLDSKR